MTTCVTLAVSWAVAASAGAADFVLEIRPVLELHCFACHGPDVNAGGLDLTAVPWKLEDPATRGRWVQAFDRIAKQEMPPPPQAGDLVDEERKTLLAALGSSIHDADQAEVRSTGRGPLRRLNRDEFEQNLRDLLRLPDLNIRDILPEDREGGHFNKTSEMLDLSRVQLTTYLDAAEAALRQAVAGGISPPAVVQFRAPATRMFEESETFGNREAMFYAKDGKMLPLDAGKLGAIRQSGQHDPQVEMALFRSAHWPYYGYPEGFLAKLPGRYQVRFSARAVVQLPDYVLQPARQPVPMTFRARKRSGPDVSGDVRATGGIMDIQPVAAVYATTILLQENETFEYSLLGLPVPLARNVNNGPPTYRYPPLPAEGQPGVAFQWIEVAGPITPEAWPPPSHRVLFEDLPIRALPGGEGRLPIEIVSGQAPEDARRLLRRFIQQAARQPVPAETVQQFERLVLVRLDHGEPLAEALLAGYQAFLCSGHFLYLQEPQREDDHFAIASRLAHFLVNSRPDAALAKMAENGRLREAAVLRAETDRLIASDEFERFVNSFTDYWLQLRHVSRDEPDVRLYPEYRFDNYLVESMERETRAFFTALVRENLPATALVQADFVFANDRLAKHYGLPPLSGSDLRKAPVPNDSPYGGLLTQGAILKVTANGTTTSPVVRGAWIMDRLIGEPPPPPPPNVPAVEPDIRGAKTIRDLLALHTQSKTCAACHARFDPVGLALENFDIFGGWRTRYRGLDVGERVGGIDRAGHDFAYTLAALVETAGQLRDGRAFRDVRELKALLAANPRQLARNLLHQFTIYATGTPVRFSDRREVESLLDACAAEGYRTRDLLHALIRSRIFLGPAGCH